MARPLVEDRVEEGDGPDEDAAGAGAEETEGGKEEADSESVSPGVAQVVSAFGHGRRLDILRAMR